MPVTVNEIVFKLYSININELIGLPVISGGLLKKSSSTIIMCARTHVCVCAHVYIQKMHISVIFCYDVSSEALYEHKPFSFMKSPKIRWNYFWKRLMCFSIIKEFRSSWLTELSFCYGIWYMASHYYVRQTLSTEKIK